MAPATSASRLGFSPARYYRVAEFNRPLPALAISDLNRDRRQDLITGEVDTEGFARATSVLFGRSHGRFGRARDLGLDGTAEAEVAEFNGDTNPDVVRPDGTENIGVGLGDGRGGLSLRGRFPVGSDPDALVSGDFDGDTRRDLVVGPAPSAGNGLRLLLGDGAGGFLPPRILRPGTRWAGPLATADLNRDRRLDLVVAKDGGGEGGSAQRGRVGVLLGTGDGSFALAASYPARGLPRSAATARLNRDRHLDLAVASTNANTRVSEIRVLLGDGKGNFRHADRYRTDPGAESLAIADFDRDRRQDLAVILENRSGRGDVRVLHGTGRGTFPRLRRFALPGCFAGFGVGLAVGQLNQDRRPDLVASCGERFSSAGLFVLLNKRR